MTKIYFVDRFKEWFNFYDSSDSHFLKEKYEGLIGQNKFRKTEDEYSEFLKDDDCEIDYMDFGAVGQASFEKILNSILYYDDRGYFDYYLNPEIKADPFSYEQSRKYKRDLAPISENRDPYFIRNYRLGIDFNPIFSVKDEVYPNPEYRMDFYIKIYPDYTEDWTNDCLVINLSTFKSFKYNKFEVARIKNLVDYDSGFYGPGWYYKEIEADSVMIFNRIDIEFGSIEQEILRNYESVFRTAYTFVYHWGAHFLSQNEDTYKIIADTLKEKNEAFKRAFKSPSRYW